MSQDVLFCHDVLSLVFLHNVFFLEHLHRINLVIFFVSDQQHLGLGALPYHSQQVVILYRLLCGVHVSYYQLPYSSITKKIGNKISQSDDYSIF